MSASNAAAYAADASSRIPKQTLDQEDFLKLLVTQMTQQDPMSPMKDTEFISQMASFSALEQNKAMMKDMAQLRAANLLGATVTVADDLSSTGMTSGIVSSIVNDDGVPKLLVNGGRFDLSAVLTVETATTVTPASGTAAAATSGSDSTP